jgi:hypothetical protein
MNTMDISLSYCKDASLRCQRLREFYGVRPQDRIFARIEVPTAALREFAQRYPAGPTLQPSIDERVSFWDAMLRERSAVCDDSIPSAYLSEMDQGLYGGMVGGKVEYMADPDSGWISSIVPPILQDWPGLETLQIDHEGECYRYYLRSLQAFRESGRGKFGTSHFILINGLNFLFELFGATRTYLELLDNPEKVCAAIEFAHGLNLNVQKKFFQEIPLLADGTCSNMVEWIPGRVISESVDPFHMTSVDYFEKWGRGPLERIMAEFDGGVLHIHANGRHLLEAVSGVRGLRAVYLLNDLHYPSAFSQLQVLKARLGTIPIVVNADFAEFVEALGTHQLAGGVLYKVQKAPDVDAANRLMEQVREYRL